jgi:DNA-binding transcriptional MerR regulator
MTTSGVSRMVGVPESTIRYWESYYGLNVGKDSKGHRVYKPENIQSLFFIRRKLHDEMMSPKELRALLRRVEI